MTKSTTGRLKDSAIYVSMQLWVAPVEVPFVPPGDLLAGEFCHAEPAGEPRDIRMLRLREIMRRTTLSAAQIYALIAAHLFPRGVLVGSRMRAWPEHVIDAWLESRLRVRDAMRTLQDEVELPIWTPALEAASVPRCRGLRMLRLSDVEAPRGVQAVAALSGDCRRYISAPGSNRGSGSGLGRPRDRCVPARTY